MRPLGLEPSVVRVKSAVPYQLGVRRICGRRRTRTLEVETPDLQSGAIAALPCAHERDGAPSTSCDLQLSMSYRYPQPMASPKVPFLVDICLSYAWVEGFEPSTHRVGAGCSGR